MERQMPDAQRPMGSHRKIPLKTINADNPKGNLLKGLILRERHAHGADKQREYSSWGGGNHHQTTTFGTLRLMR